VPLAVGAGSITLTPSTQAPGASVSVAGTGFGSSTSVGIGFGAEVRVTGEDFHPITNGLGPHKYNFTKVPIKPGTFVVHVNVNSGLSVYDVYDDGTGGLTSASSSITGGSINYATGEYATYTRVDPSGFTIVHTASYITYQYNMTPAARVNTTVSGSFTTNITVPSVANGNYNVTAIDSSGNMATATSFSIIPEVLPLGAVLLLSSMAVVAGSWYFRKRPTITK
jgi:hypothetical protein